MPGTVAPCRPCDHHLDDATALAHPRVGGIGTVGFLADVGHEVPTSMMAGFVTSTLGAPTAALA